jgi:hypothetical protein
VSWQGAVVFVEVAITRFSRVACADYRLLFDARDDFRPCLAFFGCRPGVSPANNLRASCPVAPDFNRCSTSSTWLASSRSRRELDFRARLTARLA